MSARTESIEVVLVEDHPTFRFGLRVRLEMEPDLVVVGEAGTGRDALGLVEQLVPHVVVVDLNLPDMDGVTLVRRLVTIAPRVAPLVLTMLDDESVFGAVRAGARGYLLKDAEPGRIVAAIRAVAAGETVFSGPVARRLLEGGRTGPDARGGVFPELSNREHEILDLVARGLTNGAIGQRLGLRPKTVRNYVSNVVTKLQAVDRAEAITRARGAGLAADPPRS